MTPEIVPWARGVLVADGPCAPGALHVLGRAAAEMESTAVEGRRGVSEQLGASTALCSFLPSLFQLICFIFSLSFPFSLAFLLLVLLLNLFPLFLFSFDFFLFLSFFLIFLSLFSFIFPFLFLFLSFSSFYLFSLFSLVF